MKLTEKLIERAKDIRHQAALKWGCLTTEIDWQACVSEAYQEVKTGVTFSFSPSKVTLALDWNAYKGSGKAWLAEVTLSVGGRVTNRNFVNPVATERNGYKGVKEYELESDTGKIYESCECGTKKNDYRKLIKVENGEIVKIRYC